MAATILLTGATATPVAAFFECSRKAAARCGASRGGASVSPRAGAGPTRPSISSCRHSNGARCTICHRVNAERGPDYFRLDSRLDRTFRLGDVATIFAGAQNVTNRRNFAGSTWDRRHNRLKALQQPGAFPIVGLEWPF